MIGYTTQNCILTHCTKQNEAIKQILSTTTAHAMFIATKKAVTVIKAKQHSTWRMVWLAEVIRKFTQHYKIQSQV